MTTAALRPSAPSPWIAEWVAETRRMLREPGFVAPAVGFPVAFYVLFALVLPMGGRSEAAAIATFVNYAAFGVVGAMLFGCALTLANDRDLGVLKLKRVTPLPIAVYFFGKLAAAQVMVNLIFAILAAIAVVAAGVRLAPMSWLLVWLVMNAAAPAFGALGLAIGAWFSGKAAPGIVNLIYLPMAALGGLWFPLAIMPKAMQLFAYALPTFYFGELARGAAGLPANAPIVGVAGLVVTLLVGVAVARAGLRKQPF